MTLVAPPPPWSESAISVNNEVVTIHEIAFLAPSASRYLHDRLDLEGPEAVANLLRRALSIGLVVAMTTETPSGLDTHSVNEVLTGFSDQVATRATNAVRQIDGVLARAGEAEQSLAETARLVLGGLPGRVETLLSELITQHLAGLNDHPQPGGLPDRSAVAERVNAALNELGRLEQVRTDAHRAKSALDDVLITAQDVRENLRVNLIEAAQMLRG